MKKSSYVKLAIMSLFFLQMSPSSVTVAIQSISDAFPNIPYSSVLLLSTITSLLYIPTALIIGNIAGSKVKYRTLIMVGVTMSVVFGVLPMFLNSFYLILLSRALMGFSTGIMNPLSNSMALSLFEGSERDNFIGHSHLVSNLGGITIQMVASILCGINWRYTFLIHTIGLAVLGIEYFYLPEPEKVEIKEIKGGKIHNIVYILSLISFITFIVSYPSILNMSSYIIKGNIGSTSTVGFVLSMSTVGGMTAGLIYGKLYKKLGDFMWSSAYIAIIFGLSFIYFGNNIITYTMGAICLGFGFTSFTVMGTVTVGSITTKDNYSKSIAIFMSSMALSGVIISFYINFVENILGFTLIKGIVLIAIVINLLFLIYFLIYGFKNRKVLSFKK